LSPRAAGYRQISGKTSVLEPNIAALETAALEFNDTNAAVLRRKYSAKLDFQDG
jgi:hypothetical protein